MSDFGQIQNREEKTEKQGKKETAGLGSQQPVNNQ